MKKKDKPIIVEQIFNVSKSTLWNAITNIDEMRNWYFENIPDFKPEVGFTTKFNVQSEERNFMHLWKVIEVIPQKLIKYNWKYEKYSGDSNVTFELIEENDSTLLKLTVDVLEDFPEDIQEFKRESCVGGWNYFIKNRLKDYIENKN